MISLDNRNPGVLWPTYLFIKAHKPLFAPSSLLQQAYIVMVGETQLPRGCQAHFTTKAGACIFICANQPVLGLFFIEKHTVDGRGP